MSNFKMYITLQKVKDPLLSGSKPLHQSEAWLTTIHIKISFNTMSMGPTL